MEDKLFDDITSFLKNPDVGPDEGKLLSSEEVQTIILSLATKRGEEGFTEDEAVNLIRWCEIQLAGEALVQLLLGGYIYLDDPTGKFEEPLVHLTPYGLSQKDKLT